MCWQASRICIDHLPIRNHKIQVIGSFENPVLSNPTVPMRRSLFKYYSQIKYAEALLNGEVFFQSLGYFRNYEDDNTRGDELEGTSVYKPTEGLLITNQTQRTQSVLHGWSFESTANLEEILVFCTSRVLSPELWKRFKAAACVEILNTARFCARIEEAREANTFYARPVTYYPPTEAPNPRWALPDVIATSKRDEFAWQREYRFVLATPSALEFEKAKMQLIRRVSKDPPNSSPHTKKLLKIRNMEDICRLHLP